MYKGMLFADIIKRSGVRTSLYDKRGSIFHEDDGVIVFDISDLRDMLAKDGSKLPEVEGAVPPYKSCWFEWKVEVGYDALGKINYDYHGRNGVLVSKAETETEKLGFVNAFNIICTKLHSATDLFALARNDLLGAIVDDDKILVSMFHCITAYEYLHVVPVCSIGWSVMVIDRQGRLCSKIYKVMDAQGEYCQGSFRVSSSNEVQDFIKENIDMMYDQTCFILLVMMYLNCRNVITVEHKQRDLFRHERRRNEPPFVKYHTLAVKPVGKKYEGNGNDSEKGVMPLHLVRGHFKTYTEERPLLGKVTGRFWWPSHARGTDKVGIVFKDYKMEKE